MTSPRATADELEGLRRIDVGHYCRLVDCKVLDLALAELAELRGRHDGWEPPSSWRIVSGDSHESWLAARADYLTASDVASIMGVGKYANRAATVKKKALGTTIPTNDAMKAGHALEGGILDLEAELSGRRFVRVRSHSGASVLVAHPTIPRLAASLDGVELDDAGCAIAAVEVKCTRGWLSKWNGWPPTKVQLQVQMACAGLDTGHIVLNSGTEQQRLLDIPPRDDFRTDLPALVEEFWYDVDAVRAVADLEEEST